jgi:hypothetical protein
MERVEKIGFKTAMRRDNKHLAGEIQQAHMPHICAEQFDGGRKHLLEPLMQALRAPEPRTQFVQTNECVGRAAVALDIRA